MIIDRHFAAATAMFFSALLAPSLASAHEADAYMVQICSGSPETIAQCKEDQNAFRKIYKAAFANDYQAQRNLAYMLSEGRGIVIRNRIAGCAWRMTIVALASKRVDETDRGNLRVYCEMISADEREQAVEQAKILGRRILAGGKIDETS